MATLCLSHLSCLLPRILDILPHLPCRLQILERLLLSAGLQWDLATHMWQFLPSDVLFICLSAGRDAEESNTRFDLNRILCDLHPEHVPFFRNQEVPGVQNAHFRSPRIIDYFFTRLLAYFLDWLRQ